jgi:hypothetical protein
MRYLANRDVRDTALIVAFNSDNTHAVAEGSAIVCWPDENGEPRADGDGLVTIWFEGNIHRAANLTRFVERVRSAAGRMETRYPTIAMQAIPASELYVVAEFDLRRRVIGVVRDLPALENVAKERLEPADFGGFSPDARFGRPEEDTDPDF